ncbi:MAG: c(7)-type cytochrome triheme domain-containing protein [Candidatus Thiodiazotropha sp.]
MISKVIKSSLGTGSAQQIVILFCVLTLVACSTKTKQIFFDIQPPTPKELAEKEQRRQAEMEEARLKAQGKREPGGMGSMAFAFEDNAPRPEIESVTEWKKVKKLLPKDYKKNIDWSRALNEGLIRPRVGQDPRALLATAFQWDFMIKGEEPDEDAFFPHSAHTVWLGCKNCHNPELYPYKRNPATMKEMKRGASCGACHGKRNVSFSLKACDRCHINEGDDEEDEDEDE